MGTVPLSPISSTGYSTDDYEEETKELFVRAFAFSYARATLADEILFSIIEDRESLERAYVLFHGILESEDGDMNDDVFRSWDPNCPADFSFNHEDDPCDTDAADAAQILDPRISDAIHRLVPAAIPSSRVLLANYFSHVATLLSVVPSLLPQSNSNNDNKGVPKRIVSDHKKRALLAKLFGFKAGSSEAPRLDPNLGTSDQVDQTLNQIYALLSSSEGALDYSVFRDIHPRTPLWFQFSLKDKQDRDAAVAAVELDQVVSSSKAVLVPREMSEVTFFFNYFSHILDIREKVLDQGEDTNEPEHDAVRVNNTETNGNQSDNASHIPSRATNRRGSRIRRDSFSKLELDGTALASKRDLVLVGSKNPVKLRACEIAFREAFPKRNFEFVAIGTESGVADQPMSDSVTYRGAVNRATACWNLAQSNSRYQDAQFFVGMEGGIRQFALKECKTKPVPSPPTPPNVSVTNEVLLPKPPATLECFAWIAVYDAGTEMWGSSRSASFPLPGAIEHLIKQGIELGDADAKVFGRTNAGRGEGTIGLLTKGAITRMDMYQHATVMALVPFMNVNHYM